MGQKRGPGTKVVHFSLSQMLHYISPDRNPTALSPNSEGQVVSQVVVAETSVSHSGRYRCEPAQAPYDQVTVHVLDGEFLDSREK